jgi:CheY-like chemotaxis protein
MIVVLIDDDQAQADEIEAALARVCGGVEVKRHETEHDFCAALGRYEQDPPDVFIIDMMVPWTIPSESQPPAPDEVRSGKYYTAGFRCLDRLAKTAVLCDVPRLLYTLFREEQLQDMGATPCQLDALVTKEYDHGVLVQRVLNVVEWGAADDA